MSTDKLAMKRCSRIKNFLKSGTLRFLEKSGMSKSRESTNMDKVTNPPNPPIRIRTSSNYPILSNMSIDKLAMKKCSRIRNFLKSGTLRILGKVGMSKSTKSSNMSKVIKASNPHIRTRIVPNYPLSIKYVN